MSSADQASWENEIDDDQAPPQQTTLTKFNVNAAEFIPGGDFDRQATPLEQAAAVPETPAYPLTGKERETTPETDPEAPDEAAKAEDVVVRKATKTVDERPHLNLVFIGHVDHGKSTTCGNILLLSGRIDPRLMEKYEKEAKEKGRDSWYLAFIMDINEEERAKGKTVEVGRAELDTEHRRFTLLDAPGHKAFVPNMIDGAAQADVGVLITSARLGEFETGFEKGGQTREHAVLARTLGVNRIIVAVNKMDDETCKWNEERYREIVKKVTPYLKVCGYHEKDVDFVPISGLRGENIKYHVSVEGSPVFNPAASWYGSDMPTLWTLLEATVPPVRNAAAGLRIPLLDGYRDSGVFITGKVEAGTVTQGSQVMLMPSKMKLKVISVLVGDDDEVCAAPPGENVVLKVSGCEETDVQKGSVLCAVDDFVPISSRFKVQMRVVELLEKRPLLSPGYQAVFHVHTAADEVVIDQLLESTDLATKKKKINPTFVRNNTNVIAVLQVTRGLCVEAFDKNPQLGRFTLRDEEKTIAIGKIVEVY